MRYETATILFRHGEDDFAAWDVDLPEQLLREVRYGQNTATGDLAFILDQLPIEASGKGGARCQFLFEDGSAFALFSAELGPDFFDRHQGRGCFTRGGKEEVLAELEEQFQRLAHQWEMVM